MRVSNEGADFVWNMNKTEMQQTGNTAQAKPEYQQIQIGTRPKGKVKEEFPQKSSVMMINDEAKGENELCD